MSANPKIVEIGLRFEDGEEILDFKRILQKEWNPRQWYSVSAIATKVGRHRKTIIYWREIGIKVNGVPLRLKMAKRPGQWYARGEWIIDFFIQSNIDE